MKRVFALAIAVLTGCAGVGAPTQAPSPPSPTPADALARIVAWPQTAGITVRCGEWLRELDDQQRTDQATSVLTTLRHFDDPGAPVPNSRLVDAFVDGLSDLCGAGSDCEDPDRWCDTDFIAEPASAFYIQEHDLFKPE